MKITCQACGAKYAIADEKVRGRRVKVRCKSCNEPIIVDGYNELAGAEERQATATVPAVPAAQPAAADMWSVNLTDTDQRNMSTNELVSAWNAGQLPADSYVWREGMDDWVPLASAPDLQPYLSNPANSAPVAAPAVAPAAQPVFGSSPFAFPSAQANSRPEAARVSSPRSVGADLFGNAAYAGSEEEGVVDSGPGSTPYDDGRLTGARNENSVLFSLDALKAGVGPSPVKSREAPVPTATGEKANLDDLMNIGGAGSPLFGFGTNQALLNAPPPPPEPPPRPSIPSEAGMGASIVPSSLMPPPRNNKMVFIVGGAVGLLAVIAIVIGLVAIKSGKSGEVAKDEMSANSKNDKKGSTGSHGSDDKKSDDSKSSDDKKSDESASAGPADSSKAPVTEEEKKRFAEAMKKEKEAKDGKTDEKKDDSTATKSDPSSGVASFNKGAAISALGAAAAQAAGCKRPGGPTGTGKAIVTFAPSGRVTSANVTGGEFPGTSVGSCVASVFHRAVVPAFSGDSVTVAKSFSIPK